MTINELQHQLESNPTAIEFSDVMAVIAENYSYKPTSFSNGELVNAAGENEGSCKIFALAQILTLSKEQTLACFGQYYRDDVLGNPGGSDHANIRNFMVHGIQGVKFAGEALTAN